MALIKCKDCGKEVSSQAAACPDCGSPINPPKTRSVPRIVITVILTLITLAILVFIIIPGACAGLFIVGESAKENYKEAKGEDTKIQIKNIESALKLFRLDNGYYPETEQGLEALISPPTYGRKPCCYHEDGYLDGDKVPQDMWKSDFIYIGPDRTGDGSYEVISLGEDGVVDTKDDISSKELD